MKPKFYIGIVVIIAFSIFAFGAFQSSVTPYVTFSESFDSVRNVQVMGYFTGGEARYDLEKGYLEFELEDVEGTRVWINFHGAKPANFENAESVVVVGKYDGILEVFQAEDILVKCPSKYEGG
ncbi:cytochrome c maturation protein CcmE domain-containing protein [Candidatus Contubernalis alkaliaceticus]|uniref:cytochrome c maturation protein CcmE domain-containing protein n=1 Tax=Candidatus Contubernalis alkaliaceticus TaxID=338645 RepID=UPI001F4C4851|nr:cytochrome c maturation protein CcmE [Candidatus Contubernalis alkalaceticus]UNC92955.1 cytochrome c maturation protein CcmE [Candidatus Contubernalis alkalaceticus]